MVMSGDGKQTMTLKKIASKNIEGPAIENKVGKE